MDYLPLDYWDLTGVLGALGLTLITLKFAFGGLALLFSPILLKALLIGAVIGSIVYLGWQVYKVFRSAFSIIGDVWDSFNHGKSAFQFFLHIPELILNGFKKAFNFIIYNFNHILKAFNYIPGINIPLIPLLKTQTDREILSSGYLGNSNNNHPIQTNILSQPIDDGLRNNIHNSTSNQTTNNRSQSKNITIHVDKIVADKPTSFLDELAVIGA